MKIEGKCDFCAEEGEWEAGLFEKQREALARPAAWAAMFPWSRKTLPKDCNFSPESLQEHGVTTRLACPKCFREKSRAKRAAASSRSAPAPKPAPKRDLNRSKMVIDDESLIEPIGLNDWDD